MLKGITRRPGLPRLVPVLSVRLHLQTINPTLASLYISDATSCQIYLIKSYNKVKADSHFPRCLSVHSNLDQVKVDIIYKASWLMISQV